MSKKFKVLFNGVEHKGTSLEDFPKEKRAKELEQKLKDIHEKNLKDPKYRKSHCLELSEN